jgi:hypothetical protein
MAVAVPPIPVGEDQNSFAWNQWYLALSQLLGTSGSIAWALIDFSGSDLQDIATRNHSSLQNFQGGIAGERYHLTQAQNLAVASLSAGTWTPTLTGVANVAASTAYVCNYMKLGDIVTASGRVDVDPTAAVSTQLGISLPIASNFAADTNCAGTASAPGVASMSAAILGDGVNDRAQMQWIATDLTNQPWYFTFTYRVI